MKKLVTSAFALTILANVASAQLYGIGSINGTDTLYTINTSSGAATSVFSWTNGGGSTTNGLAYNPSTNRFNAVHYLNSTTTQLWEIDHIGLTATAVTHQIPTNYFEGLDYNAALGGLVVSYGGLLVTNKLALLDNSYNLIANQVTTSLADADCLVTTGSGTLNSLDTNNPSGSPAAQRNQINNAFGVMSLTGVGLNMFNSSTDFDMAWKQDESRMFLTRGFGLAEVNDPSSNLITNVGNYGVGSSGALIRITGIAAAPVPEPTSMMALFAGLGMLAKKRIRKA